MTVKELIERLDEYPDDFEVILLDKEDDEDFNIQNVFKFNGTIWLEY